MRLSLDAILFKQDTQKHLLRMVAADLQKLSSVPPLDWLGMPLGKPKPARKGPVQWSSADIVGADRRPEDDPAARVVDFDAVSAEICRVADSGTGLHCVFAILLCIFASDNLMDMVVAGTPRNVCERYFTGFEHRMTVGLCGEMGYDNATKSGQVLCPAKPPCQIAIEELMLAERVYAAHGLASQTPPSRF